MEHSQHHHLVRAKDHISMATILAIAGAAWCAWGSTGGLFQGWSLAGIIGGALLFILCVVRFPKAAAPPTMATDPHARKIYWLSVAAEIVLILVGLVVLPALGQAQLFSTWVLLVVGVHFFPFVGPFRAPVLRYTAVGCIVVVLLALWSQLAAAWPALTVSGLGGGAVLLVSSALCLWHANAWLKRARQGQTEPAAVRPA